MITFDQLVNQKMTSVNGFYRRYSDDLLILCPIEQVEDINSFIIRLIEKECKLEINPSKTNITIFKTDESGKLRAISNHGTPSYLQYLGFEFDGKNILIRSSSISRYYRKMNQRIKKAASQAKFSKTNTTKIFKRKLYNLYSHIGLGSELGRRNFISYGYRSSEITNSAPIRKQLSKHWSKLNKRIAAIKRKKGL